MSKSFILTACILWQIMLTYVGDSKPMTERHNFNYHDTIGLQIQVVHNPKYPTTYGVKLLNTDTIHTVKIQKVKLGRTEKIYPAHCQLNESPFGGIFEFCVIKPQYDSIFALELLDSTASKLKCEVYYTSGQVKKMNSTEVVERIDCLIGFSHGVAPKEESSACIWSIGWGQ
jgi:hypothetical protein